MTTLGKVVFNVKSGNVRRFERRTGAKLFLLFGNAMREAVKGGEENKINAEVLAMEAIAPVFQVTEDLGAFIYECGLTEEERKAEKFDDWFEEIPFDEIFALYDEALMALFLSSPPQTSPTEKAEAEAAEAGKDAKTPVTSGPGTTST